MPKKAARTPRNGNRPDVIVDFVFERGLLFLSIQNIGDKPACEVRVRFSEPIRGIEDKEISALPLFQQLEFLAPHKEIRTLLDSSAAYFRSGQPTKIVAQVRYKDVNGAKHAATIRHNLEIYRDIGYLTAEPSPQE